MKGDFEESIGVEHTCSECKNIFLLHPLVSTAFSIQTKGRMDGKWLCENCFNIQRVSNDESVKIKKQNPLPPVYESWSEDELNELAIKYVASIKALDFGLNLAVRKVYDYEQVENAYNEMERNRIAFFTMQELEVSNKWEKLTPFERVILMENRPKVEPYPIGQEIEVIVDKPLKNLKAGKVFKVKGVADARCSCHSFAIDIGRTHHPKVNFTICSDCGTVHQLRDRKVWLKNTYFKSL